MPDIVVLLVLPGLRERDLAQMPQLQHLITAGDIAALAPSFPCLNAPVQANLITGVMPQKHGIIADAFFSRERRNVERGAPWHACLEQPAVWDVLRSYDLRLVTAAWFSSDARTCQTFCSAFPPADRWQTSQRSPARHSVQASEQVRGETAAGTLCRADVNAAIELARQHRPDFFYLCFDHLAPAAELYGPDSAELDDALASVDELIGRLSSGFGEAYGRLPLWLTTGGYAISPVTHVTFPNRILHDAGMLSLREIEAGLEIDFTASQAWALVDRQISHVFVADRDPRLIERVAQLFEREACFAAAIGPNEMARRELNHARSGDVILISSPHSWQAFKWWQNDADAPAWAAALGSPHQPGIDPRETWSQTSSGSLAAVKGSHGAPARDESQRSFIASSEPGVLAGRLLADTDVYDLVLRQFGI